MPVSKATSEEIAVLVAYEKLFPEATGMQSSGEMLYRIFKDRKVHSLPHAQRWELIEIGLEGGIVYEHQHMEEEVKEIAAYEHRSYLSRP